MEPITQVLASVALARCGFKRVTPLALPIMVTAGLAPDLDWVSVFGGARVFLEAHRTAADSLVGIVVIAALIAAGFVSIAPRIRERAGKKRAETSLPAGRQGTAPTDTTKTVSYTHLDVYKRQRRWYSPATFQAEQAELGKLRGGRIQMRDRDQEKIVGG